MQCSAPKKNDDDNKQRIKTFAAAAVKILVLSEKNPPKTPSSFLVPVDETHLVTAMSAISGSKLHLFHINNVLYS